MIKAENLTKYYGELCALDNVCFTVEAGHIYGFLGLNGAGKSTAMNIITGALVPSFGSVSVNGFDIARAPLEARRHIGYLPEQPPLYGELTVREYLTFVAGAKGIKKSLIPGELRRVTGETGISAVSDRLISSLSKGFRQRVGIAQAILGSPEVIILDEPTVGLDPAQVVEVRSLIRKLSGKRTIILSSHILSEIEELCDRIIILSGGRLIASDSLEHLLHTYAANDLLTLTVRCGEKRAREIVSEIKGVSEAAVLPSKTAGATELVLKLPKGRDIRDAVFYTFARVGTAILAMNYKVSSLEDAFLKAVSEAESRRTGTSAGQPAHDSGEQALQNSGAASDEPADSVKKSKKKNDANDDGSDDYRPLFG